MFFFKCSPSNMLVEGLVSTSSGCLTNCWEFVSRHTDHAQFAYLATSAQVKQCQANNTDFLVGAGSFAINKAGRILSSSNLVESVSSSNSSSHVCNRAPTHHEHIGWPSRLGPHWKIRHLCNMKMDIWYENGETSRKQSSSNTRDQC
jgi:hypothetical protein